LKEAELQDPLAIANLIFRPSLSTKSEVSDLSGRGVGMDAVKDFVEKNGGSISIAPKGELTNEGFLLFGFVIRLPRALFVVLHADDFARVEEPELARK